MRENELEGGHTRAARALASVEVPVKTKAAVLWEYHTPWSVEEVELDDPQQGEVRVRLASSGMCHSDDHVLKADLPVPTPVVGGHEGAGIVEAVGSGVTRLQEGDHVVLQFMPACGHCRWCATGQQHLCDVGAGIMDGMPISNGKPRVHARGTGLGAMAVLGTFSPYIVVHEFSCVKVDPSVELKFASLIGCGVITGYGAAVHRARVEPGDTVVVVGTGGVGISAVQGARIAGAETIVAVDPIEFRRESARQFGATHTAPSMEEAVELVSDLTRGVMADKTILTVGLLAGHMVAPLLALTRKGGRACLTSTAPPTVTSAEIGLTDLVFSQKELVGNVYGGANGPSDVPNLLRLYQKGLLKLDEMVTKTYTLEQINEGYADTLAGRIVRGLIIF
jgi:S-(hydroxymethyl)glutathione dehydrogenase/alcohol dehydrogenase